jgi:hypothetical protein
VHTKFDIYVFIAEERFRFLLERPYLLSAKCGFSRQMIFVLTLSCDILNLSEKNVPVFIISFMP